MKIERVNYGGWPNCYRLVNDVVELMATTDVGPRIIRYGLIGRRNVFHEFTEMLGKSGGNEWRIYGGHRLWQAPEVKPQTYAPDNDPIQFELLRDGICLIQPVEPSTGIQKEIEVRLLDDALSHVEVKHRLRNRNASAVRLAPWALSAMAQGGTLILPLPAGGEHEKNLLPVNSLALWTYTNLADPRWTFSRNYILLRQDPNIASPQKIGAAATAGWLAYVIGGEIFVKTSRHVDGADYPDFGCSAETFTNESFLEAETLGPLVVLQPSEQIEHVENWFLMSDVLMPLTAERIERAIVPRIRQLLQQLAVR